MWRRADTRGIALVSALWGSAIIAVIVLSVLQLVRSDAGTGRGRRDVAALGAIADGAINLTILTMLSPEGAQTPTDGTPLVVAFAGHDVQVSVHDEAGKIDVNLANAPTLGRILVSVGVDGNTAQQLAERIVARRQPASGETVLFQSPEELQLVGGVTADVYRRIAPLVTVYSHAPWIDPSRATLGVLNVFRAADAGADAAYRRMEEEQRGLRPRSPSPGVQLGHAFTITARVFGAASARVTRTAVIRLTGQQQVPLLIYRWG